MKGSKFAFRAGICIAIFFMSSTSTTSYIPEQYIQQEEQMSTIETTDEIDVYEEAMKEDEIQFVSIMAESALDEYTVVGDEEEEEVPVEENNEEYVEINVVVSYYTGVDDENGGYEGMNALGGRLTETSIAIPRPRENSLVKYGTIIEFDDLGESYMNDYNGKHLTRIADDCGNVKHIRIREDGVYRMDIYCPRFKNESISEYKKRVTSYGKYSTTAKVLLNN